MTEYLCENCHETWSVYPPNGECRGCGEPVEELTDEIEQSTLFDADYGDAGGAP